MRFVTALLAAVALFVLPACGGEKASAAERIAAAPEATAEDGTAKMTMTMASKGGPQDVTVQADGAVDFAAKRMKMTMDMGAAAQGMGEITMLADGTTLYMKMPNMKQLGLPTPWLKVDLESMPGMQGLGNLQQLNNDPSNSMQMLRGVSEDVEEVGAEEIRGEQTTHYKANVDMEKAVADSPPEARKYIRAQFEKAGIQTLPIDVWIDEAGRMRKQTFTMDLSKMEGGGGQGTPTSMDMTIEMFDFGTEVDVEVPPKNKVTDFAKLQGKAPAP